MFSNIKNKKGITLIALIVTVIILLILAGISIASLTGNGLFEKAKLAKEKQVNAEIEENEKLGDYENAISEAIVGNRDTVEETKTILTTNGKYNFTKKGNIVYCSFYDKGISIGDYRQTTTGILLEELPYKIDETKYNLFDIAKKSSENDTSIDTYFTSNVYSLNGYNTLIRVMVNGKLQVFYQNDNNSDSNRTVSGTFWYFTKD